MQRKKKTAKVYEEDHKYLKQQAVEKEQSIADLIEELINHYEEKDKLK